MQHPTTSWHVHGVQWWTRQGIWKQKQRPDFQIDGLTVQTETETFKMLVSQLTTINICSTHHKASPIHPYFNYVKLKKHVCFDFLFFFLFTKVFKFQE